MHVTTFKKVIQFATSDVGDLTADLYYPQNDKPLPIILYIHGGAWKAGSKEMFTSWGPYLAQNGFLVMSVNYRLSEPSRPSWPGVMDDMRAALDWLHQTASKQWKLDLNRVTVIGESCGAQLATLLAIENKTPATIRTIIGVYGIYDLADWRSYTRKVREDDPVVQFLGGAPEEIDEQYLVSSPAARLAEEIPKTILETDFFLLWGEEDDVVPASQSEKFAKLLSRRGVSVETCAVPEKGHYWFSVLPWLEGGTVNDDPNPQIATKLLCFLNEKNQIGQPSAM